MKAGLSPANAGELIEYLVAVDIEDAMKVPGVTQGILNTAALTLHEAYSNAFEVVYLVTLSWGILSCIAAWFTPSIEDLYTDEVMRQLRDGFGGSDDHTHQIDDDYPMGQYEAKGNVFEHQSRV